MATTPSPAVSAMPVLISGSSAGSTAPKNSSRMTSAPRTPISVLDEDAGLVEAATAPTTSICRTGEFGARASFTNLAASAAEMLLASLLKLTVANAMRLLTLTCFAPAGV